MLTKQSFFPTRYLWIGVLGIMAVALGCNPSTNKSASSSKSSDSPNEIDESTRPALRVHWVSHEDLKKPLELRWAASSQQKLEIELFTPDSFLKQSACKADVVLFPSMMLGELVERDWISPITNPNKILDLGIERWPAHWQRAAQYGKKTWAVPLGAPIPLLASSQKNGLGPGATWSQWIERIGSISGATVSDRSSPTTVAPTSTAPTSTEHTLAADQRERSGLVDRFLLLVASNASRTLDFGICFNPVDMSPRLLQPEFLLAAKQLQQLAAHGKFACMTRLEGIDQQVIMSQSAIGIGWPSAPARSDSRPKEETNQTVASTVDIHWSFPTPNPAAALQPGEETNQVLRPTYLDPGKGYLAAAARASRQSAISQLFLEWIDQDEQRLALARESMMISPIADDMNKLGATNPTLRAYWQRCQEAWTNPLLIEFRMKGGVQYRHSLDEALYQMIQNQVKAEECLAKCSSEWEIISERLGRDGQRKSMERSLQLSN